MTLHLPNLLPHFQHLLCRAASAPTHHTRLQPVVQGQQLQALQPPPAHLGGLGGREGVQAGRLDCAHGTCSSSSSSGNTQTHETPHTWCWQTRSSRISNYRATRAAECADPAHTYTQTEHQTSKKHRCSHAKYLLPMGDMGPEGPVRPPGVLGGAPAPPAPPAAPSGRGPLTGVAKADPAAAAAAAWPAAAAATFSGGSACAAVSRSP